MKAWHWVGDTLRDGSPVPRDGKKLVYPQSPILCKRGYHASLCPWDALRYAPGDVLCLVECGGTVLHQDDKLVCTERTILARMNGDPLLRDFARKQALSVVHLWEPPEIVLDYLMGNDSARDAARAAAWSAARDAAGAAAWSAAGDAAWAAARDAARAAAWSAARDAAGAAARDAVGDAAGKDFDQMVYDCFEDWI